MGGFVIYDLHKVRCFVCLGSEGPTGFHLKEGTPRAKSVNPVFNCSGLKSCYEDGVKLSQVMQYALDVYGAVVKCVDCWLRPSPLTHGVWFIGQCNRDANSRNNKSDGLSRHSVAGKPQLMLLVKRRSCVVRNVN
ncbi:hypothetical protein PLANPX_5178 [Lacipirellula parvula]|uniref:Uncharacterized protein n=1 Tax=Lacipirellula parvula TaxID=2650471 RepID=A0A5K7XLM4_9BACT|nr:hypothetical protein PLANPX_5178 [Lacipirellula parvula]